MKIPYDHRLYLLIVTILCFLAGQVCYASTPNVWTKCKRLNEEDGYAMPAEMSSAIAKIPEEEKVYVEGRLIWEWEVYRACSIGNDHISIYGAALKPAEACGVRIDEPLGILTLFKDGELIHKEINKSLVPRKIKNLQIAGQEIILYHSYHSSKKLSYLHIIDQQGNICAKISKPGRSDFRLTDIDGDGVFELSGYGLKRVYNFCFLKNLSEEKIKNNKLAELAMKLRVEKIKPAWGKKFKGLYRLFLLDKSGEVSEARGREYKEFFLAEVDRQLKYFAGMEETGRADLVNMAASFYGILLGCGDVEIVKQAQNKLPRQLREIDPVVLAEYWSVVGLHNLKSVP